MSERDLWLQDRGPCSRCGIECEGVHADIIEVEASEEGGWQEVGPSAEFPLLCIPCVVGLLLRGPVVQLWFHTPELARLWNGGRMPEGGE